MLAPCITVLSTSKNAAAVGVQRLVERGLDLRRGGRGLAGEVERCWRFSGVRDRSAGHHGVNLAA